MPPDNPTFRPPTALGGDGAHRAACRPLPNPAASPARDLTFLGRDDTPVRVLGRVLAFGTSQRDEHSHPVPADAPPGDPDRFAQKNERCSACRWFEVTIAQVEADIADDDSEEPASGRYLVVTAGRTVVPGEQNFRRAEFTDSAYEVVELLVQRRRDDHTFIPQTSARALAQAASADFDLREAYLARVA